MTANTHTTGNRGEDAACRLLLRKGYAILERKYRAQRYEIDIIAQTGNTIVFCEVKTARSRKFGPPVTWVRPEKVRRITLAAAEYIHSHSDDSRTYRFDVIGIEDIRGDLRLTHIENAFSARE